MKKKVSFDIEEEDLNNIRAYCDTKKLKMSDFLRTAAVEKWKRDDSYMTAFVFKDFGIKRFVIKEEKYEIELFNPDADLADLTGAKFEGILSFKDPSNIVAKDEIDFLIQDSPTGRVRFFTK